MAFWMEIRCDGRAEVDHGVPAEQQCWSNTNSDPQDMAGNSRRSINQNVTHLHKMARSGGWRFIEDEWLCPGCLNRRGLAPGKPRKYRHAVDAFMTPEESQKHRESSIPLVLTPPYRGR